MNQRIENLLGIKSKPSPNIWTKWLPLLHPWIVEIDLTQFAFGWSLFKLLFSSVIGLSIVSIELVSSSSE